MAPGKPPMFVVLNAHADRVSDPPPPPPRRVRGRVPPAAGAGGTAGRIQERISERRPVVAARPPHADGGHGVGRPAAAARARGAAGAPGARPRRPHQYRTARRAVALFIGTVVRLPGDLLAARPAARHAP